MTSNQTRFQAIKGKVLIAIKHRSRIKCQVTSIILKHHDFFLKLGFDSKPKY
jgi:hypothetical protein